MSYDDNDAIITEASADVPHAQHVDKVLLCHVVLLVNIPLQGRENVPLVEQDLSTFSLNLQQ